MTLKAVRIIRETNVIAVPGKAADESVAYQIAVKAVPELQKKEVIPIYMPMTHDKEEQARNHEKGAKTLETYLREGIDVAFLTLGDVSVYSTFTYLQRIVEADGYQTVMVSGVPSFCAAAARVNEPLVIWQEELHILPAVHGDGDMFSSRGNYVVMKSGRKMKQVKELLKEKKYEVAAVENCGMEGERIYRGADEIPDGSGYYSLIIAKEHKA